jgi:manganese/zinc/iron transport system ATP- binding protein
MTMQSVIKIDDLTVSYGNTRVLSNIFLNIDAGNIYGVIGPNGAGKSTLFKAILGMIKVSSGNIWVLGKEPQKAYVDLAYLPQKEEVDIQFPVIVSDVVRIGRLAHKGVFERLNSVDYEIINQTMIQLDILKLKDRSISDLSGGQQQRVFLARALAQRPKILFLDEPFVGVDIKTEMSIIQILKELAEEGVTILLVHHDLSTVSNYCDQVILINQRLIGCGPIETTFTDENIAKTYGGQLKLLHKIS